MASRPLGSSPQGLLVRCPSIPSVGLTSLAFSGGHPPERRGRVTVRSNGWLAPPPHETLHRLSSRSFHNGCSCRRAWHRRKRTGEPSGPSTHSSRNGCSCYRAWRRKKHTREPFGPSPDDSRTSRTRFRAPHHRRRRGRPFHSWSLGGAAIELATKVRNLLLEFTDAGFGSLRASKPARRHGRVSCLALQGVQ